MTENLSAVMSQIQFHLFLSSLRFHNLNNRNGISKFDNPAPIGTIFDAFVKRCSFYHSVVVYVNKDEMLVTIGGEVPVYALHSE